MQSPSRLPVTVVHPVMFGPAVARVRPLVRTVRRRPSGNRRMSVRAPSISVVGKKKKNNSSDIIAVVAILYFIIDNITRMYILREYLQDGST
jgi:hypothetical protein